MNRLAQETSPYLLQHKNNPVDWYPWGPEALSLARSEDKPILLSIGYSACHWCHVMEHESFENPTIAARMNELFVCIKVDREERPDLDHIYQNVAQALTRSGGWPLTVFLTPTLEPYFGGTYFPPEDRYGRAGFPRVLEALADAYRKDKDGIAENARKLTDFIRGMDRVPPADSGVVGRMPTRAELGRACAEIAVGMDPILGGTVGAPKFPNPMLLSYLTRYTAAERDSTSGARLVMHRTLECMAGGGIFDQLGGGFHRYSVDETWSVPHFEKMLYDNGLLLRAYSEALLLTEPTAEQRTLYLRTLRMTVEYLLREMRGPEGAFYAAQDADSEGEEGKFFAWTPAQLESLAGQGVISSEGARAFALRYGITEMGNFEHGMTVLYLDKSVAQVSALLGVQDADPMLKSTEASLFAERCKRVAPATDRKRLASWNGLAISGLCWAGRALERGTSADAEVGRRALAAASEAYEAVRAGMGRTGDRLHATLQEGTPKHNAYLDDYAFMAKAALDLVRLGPKAGPNPASDQKRVVAQAQAWIDVVLKHFDTGGAGFYFTSDDHESLIHRPKNVFDQAIPAGASVVIEVLLALGEIADADGARYSEIAKRQLALLGPLTQRAPLGLGELLSAALLAEQGVVAVQLPATAKEPVVHPHVYVKPGSHKDGALVCHAGACHGPLDVTQAAQKIARLISY